MTINFLELSDQVQVDPRLTFDFDNKQIHSIMECETETGSVKLISKEGDDFPVDIEVAKMSELVKGMLEGEILFQLLE